MGFNSASKGLKLFGQNIICSVIWLFALVAGFLSRLLVMVKELRMVHGEGSQGR